MSPCALGMHDGVALVAACPAQVRRIEVQLDPALYPGDSGRVVWDKALAAGARGVGRRPTRLLGS